MIIARERIFDRYPVSCGCAGRLHSGTPLPSLLFPRQHAPRDPPTAGAPSRVVALVALAPSPFVGAFRGLRRLHRATAAAAVAATAPAGAAVAAAAAVATAAALLFVVGLPHFRRSFGFPTFFQYYYDDDYDDDDDDDDDEDFRHPQNGQFRATATLPSAAPSPPPPMARWGCFLAPVAAALSFHQESSE